MVTEETAPTVCVDCGTKLYDPQDDRRCDYCHDEALRDAHEDRQFEEYRDQIFEENR